MKTSERASASPGCRAVAIDGLQTALARLLAWRDLLLMLLLALLTVVLRIPHMTQLPYGWDSLLYLRAMDHFNVTIHQPQPPGYLFYISTARLLEIVVGDPHSALVWLSVLSSAAAVAALYLLTRLLYDSLTGLVAGGMLMTSVTFWFYSEVAYPYTTLAAASIVLALLALAVRRGLLPGARGAALATLAFGLLGGFRQDLLLFVAPLFVAALWGRPRRDWFVAIGAGAIGVLAWLLPSASLSEGLSEYLRATSRQGGDATGASGAFDSLSALRSNVDNLATFTYDGLVFALPPLVYLLLRWLVGLGRYRDPARWWVLLWLAPPLAYYIFGHLGDIGYTFSFLPAVLVLSARGLVVGAWDAFAIGSAAVTRIRPQVSPLVMQSRGIARVVLPLMLALVLVSGNALIFLNRHVQLSATGINCYDQTMQERLRVVQERFQPEETLIFSSGYYQHVRYFLPQYRSWFYEPTAPQSSQQTIAPETRVLVIFDETARPAGDVAGVEYVNLPCNNIPFYWIMVQAGDVVSFDAQTLVIDVEP